jgi:predicted P-loop ATPase
MQNYTRKSISRFLNGKTTIPIGEDSPFEILDAIKNGDYKKEIDELRSKKTKEERDALKLNLTSWTISGQFLDSRRKENFYEHSNTISIDLDRKDNKEKDLRSVLLPFQNDPSVLGYFNSASGEGECKKTGTLLGGFAIFFAIEVRKGYEEEDQKKHFLSLEKELSALGLVIDKAPKEFNAIRFASFDPEAYIRTDRTNISPRTLSSLEEKASTLPKLAPKPSPPQRPENVTEEPLDQKFTPPPIPEGPKRKFTTNRLPSVFDYDEDDLSFAISQLRTKKIDLALEASKATNASRHEVWIKIALALANLGEGGRSYFQEISSYYSNYTPEKTDDKFNYILRTNRGEVNFGTLRYFFRIADIMDRDPRKDAMLRTAIQRRKQIGKNGGPPNEKACKDSLLSIGSFQGYPPKMTKEVVKRVLSAPLEHLDKQKNNTEIDYDELIDFLRIFPLKYNTRTRNLELEGEELSNKNINTITIEAKKILGNKLTTEAVMLSLHSNYIDSYDPFLDFLEKNRMHEPQRGLVDELLSCLRIKSEREGDTEFARLLVKKWLLGVIASMNGTHSVLCLVLCGSQGIGKTRFFRELLPKELLRYYSESKFDSGKDDYVLMTKKLIICDDEFGGKSKKEAKQFKEILSKEVVSIRKPYDRLSEDLVRLATFCGTTNDERILNDPTGNRRILPVLISGVAFDKMEKIDRVGLWIELSRMYKQKTDGFFLTKDEIQRLDEYTRERYEEVSIEKAIITKMFYLPEELRGFYNELGRELFEEYYKPVIVSTTYIKEIGEANNRFNLTINKLGEQMKSLGFEYAWATHANPVFMIGPRQKGYKIVFRPEFLEMDEARKQTQEGKGRRKAETAFLD